jgi:hypothetical protein
LQKLQQHITSVIIREVPKHYCSVVAGCNWTIGIAMLCRLFPPW